MYGITHHSSSQITKKRVNTVLFLTWKILSETQIPHISLVSQTFRRPLKSISISKIKTPERKTLLKRQVKKLTTKKIDRLSPKKKRIVSQHQFSCEPGSKLLVLGMAIQPLIGNPHNGYRLMTIPYYMEIMGV